MIIFCEECATKYKIDDAKIAGGKVRCKCTSCGHIMNVTKSGIYTEEEMYHPGSVQEPRMEVDDSQEDVFEDVPEAGLGQKMSQISQKLNLEGMTLNKKFLINFFCFVIFFLGMLFYVYIKFLPGLLESEMHVRASSLTQAFAVAVADSISRGDEVRADQISAEIARLPGVAYTAVVSSGGRLIVGQLGEEKDFVLSLGDKVDAHGFPLTLIQQNRLQGRGQQAKELSIGNRGIYDVVLPLGPDADEVHVGLFVQDILKKDIVNIAPLLVMLMTWLILGALSFVHLANTISKPIRELVLDARRISFGELERPIQIRGSGEIAELASALERMRTSIKSAIERLRKR